MQRTRPHFERACFTAGAAALLLWLAGCAQDDLDAATFYQNNTLRIVNTTGAGGTMDLYILLLTRHMGKHLPDGTDVILEHRPGAGGTVGTNYLFSAAPNNGSVIGMPTPSLVINTFTQSGARYDPTAFEPIGRVTDAARILVARSDSGITSMADARGIEATHAILAPGTTTDQVAVAANQILGTRFRRIPGYTGGGPAFVAMEQGEVASTSTEPANLFANKWPLVEAGTINVLAVSGSERLAELPDVPTLMELAGDHPNLDILDAVAGTADIGLSLIAPPGVPEDRLALLREAFARTLNDPEFIAEAAGRGIPLNFADADWLAERIRRDSEQPEHVLAWFRSLLAGVED
jgi:tripartite-type tricarboxylate transporter receptor subunit TctC